MARLHLLLVLISSFVTFVLSIQLLQSPQIIRTGPVRLPFAKKINQTSVKNVLKIDRARAAAHMARFGIRVNTPASRRDVEEPADDQAVSYVASVGVGSPATQCQSHLCLVLFCVEPQRILCRLFDNRYGIFEHLGRCW